MNLPVNLNVTVTDEDWKRGTPHNPHHCALAQCLRRKYPDAHVSVGRWTAVIDKSVYQLDLAGDLLVQDFDAGRYTLLPTDVSMRCIS
jgi:hypothetical protein